MTTDPVRVLLGEPLLTVEEVMDQLGIGRTRVYALIRNGELASVLHKRRRLVAVSSVDRYIRARAEEIRVDLQRQESAALRD